MRRLILAVAAIAALTVTAPALAATKTVNIYGSGFSPKTVTVTEGDTVTWVNRDNANHQVLAKRGQFVSTVLAHGQRFSFTFKAAGTYDYSDELHPKLTGRVDVKGAPPTLSLAVSAPIVVYDTQVALSGIVSSHKPGEQVTIYYQPYPQPNPIQLATVLTGSGGTFSFLVKPKILTTYQAAWKGTFATPTTVQVQPKLTIGRAGTWIVHAYGGRSFVGRAVQIQRLNSATGQWVTIKKVLLDARSGARCSLTLPIGLSRLRLAMSVNQAGAGYLGVIGQPISWRRRA